MSEKRRSSGRARGRAKGGSSGREGSASKIKIKSPVRYIILLVVAVVCLEFARVIGDGRLGEMVLGPKTRVEAKSPFETKNLELARPIQEQNATVQEQNAAVWEQELAAQGQTAALLRRRAKAAREARSQIVAHMGYTSNYNSSWLIPNWVAYALTKGEVHGTVQRPNKSFERDPRVIGKSAVHSDYTKSGYSRGHMAPAADMKWSEQAMYESFYLSNVCPQRPELNGGVWERLEERCRALAEDGTVYICCGPLVEVKHKRIGKNGVAVPSQFFKALCMKRNGKWQAVGFLFPNEYCSGSMFDFAMPVDELEAQTGYDFFYNLPDDIEPVIEASWRMQDWQ